ncbi:hypothetical protein ACFFX1_55305 [Dactylosporangium sucinum]|uniref:Uncharacterized protein n=1 Tax=Dactylosporangium sucinum TaxID=1424081 RepID=A0A917U295_9ACTN|nr:hypothetical protein [Dactylosporangium sucinum]GGM52849.1 hypothetical protein GCM10007977_063030 [Dactylosporangium sucinum]
MSHAQPSKIGATRTITTDARARREDRRRRLIRRDAAYANHLRDALAEAKSLRHFRRILAGA